METLILCCLVIVIALLLHDKITDTIKISSQAKKYRAVQKNDAEATGIMGDPKPRIKQELSTDLLMGQSKLREKDIITTVAGDSDIEFEIEDYEDTSNVLFNFEEEEEEWRENSVFYRYDLATGVTFDELTTVGKIFEQNAPEAQSSQEAIQIVHKLNGTELLELLESSLDNASLKIAMLLDKDHDNVVITKYKITKKDDDFDIQDFV